MSPQAVWLRLWSLTVGIFWGMCGAFEMQVTVGGNTSLEVGP